MHARTVALTLALLPALAAARDLGPGTFELSGGTSLDFGKSTLSAAGTEDVEQTTLTLAGDALYYVAKNVGLGVALSYDRTEVDFGAVGGSHDVSSSFVGPELKLSLPVSPRVSVLVAGAVGRMAQSSDGSDAAGWAYLLGGGARLFAADFVSLDALLSWSGSSIDFDGFDVDRSGWNLGLALSVFLGGPRP